MMNAGKVSNFVTGWKELKRATCCNYRSRRRLAVEGRVVDGYFETTSSRRRQESRRR